MNEDIIRMAREAGFVVGVSVEHWGDVPFAKLCHPTPTSTALYRMLESLVSRAVAAEREACARFIEDEYLRQFVRPWREDLAAAIRARGQA